MNERIMRIKQELEFYKNVRSNVDEFLFLRLPGNWYEEVFQFMAHAQDVFRQNPGETKTEVPAHF